MWSQYDEDLSENTFFKAIKENHSDILQKSAEQNWTICIPRSGSFEDGYEVSVDEILDHILIRTEDSKFSTLSRKEIYIEDQRITTESDKPFGSASEILFQETFYGNKALKYTVWCIDRPLFNKYDYCDSHKTTILRNLHDCIDFLWAESLGHDVLETIQKLCLNFVQLQQNLEIEILQTQKDYIGSLYSQCLQVCLKNRIIKDKCGQNVLFLSNLKVAVETYMQYCLGKKIIFSVNTLQHYTDCIINKIIRNSSNVQCTDLNIPSELCEAITKAKYELGKINNYVTVLDKINSLLQTFKVLLENKKLMESSQITSDDLLQIIVFFILKLQINNWAANLTYIKEFRFSLINVSDHSSYLITTLEAAIEFIKSSAFLSIQKLFLHDLEYKTDIKKKEKDVCEQKLTNSKLCHPLCSCETCETMLKSHSESPNVHVDIVNDSGQNMLIYAVNQGNVKAVESLLSEGSINFSDHFGKTALHYAAAKGFQDILFLLVNCNANVNCLDNEKNTPLHSACDRGHESCVKALIFSSPIIEVNLENIFGETPLFLATRWGYFDIVRLLLENGAAVCVKNKKNQTVYNLAPNYYIIKLFQNFGNEKSNRMLEESKENNILITTGDEPVELNCKEHGVRPRDVEDFKKIELLLRAIENNDLPLTCFHLGFSTNQSEPKAINDKKLQQKCHPLCACDKCLHDDETDYNRTQKSIKKVNINMCNVTGLTPLHVAAKYGRTEILRLLLDGGASPNIRTYKSLYTPLHLAVLNLRIKTVKELLKCGSCALDPQDVKGNTPLHYACSKNDIKMVELLLVNGADCNQKNNKGKSALQETEENSQYRVFKLLKQSLNNAFDKEFIKREIEKALL